MQMELEASHVIQMQEVKGHNPFVKAVDSIDESLKNKYSRRVSDEVVRKDKMDSSPKYSNHSELDTVNMEGQCGEIKKKILPGAEVQSSLKQEILQLEGRLQDQLGVRAVLEKAVGYKASAINLSHDSSMPMPAKELIKEIAVLEIEVMHLEQYLLSLYRKAFDQQISALSPTGKDSSKQPSRFQSGQFQETPKLDNSSKGGKPAVKPNHLKLPKKQIDPDMERSSVLLSEKQEGPSVQRSHSSLSQRAVSSARISPSEGSLARALRSSYSQPLSSIAKPQKQEGENASSGVISLADYLGTNIADIIPETPNKLSEEMVRCMAGIYCKLADPPLIYHATTSSPTSSFSSMSGVSPRNMGEVWSPGFKRESTLDARLINPFRVEGLKEFSGPYSAMVEVPLICRDRRRLRDVKDLLQNYNSFIHRLETVDPSKLNNDEKIAFWINIHNALLMHAYLVYGMPQNNVKKTSLLVKATFRVGGRFINAATIQGLILGCHTYSPGQWLRTLLYAKMKKHKAGNEWQAYSIEQPEPLLRFALCSGSHSDPAVRVYTPRRLFQQLQAAKEEFIRATVSIWKEQKILLPKAIDSYAKEMKLTSEAMVDMVQRYLPETLRMAIQRCQQRRSNKIVEWVPYNSSFRYLLSRDLVFPHIN
ncbi:uncharacterized protein [Typha angustifolia]|uniref:uncharacterized protein n=1 Tax=Typha angustifolia TaxID=59011 RepID=UPI003C2AE857